MRAEKETPDSMASELRNMQIENIEIHNYRVFKNAVMADLPRLAALVGENGAGKSTLFDVFSFLKDALAQNVAKAVARRGGFKELVSRGADGPISISLKFRETGGRLATHELSLARLFYTPDAADARSRGDLGGCRII